MKKLSKTVITWFERCKHETFVSREKYPYFKAEDDRWKNSVRHNLSMNPHFRKGSKAKHGSGHLWVLADYDTEADEAGKQSEPNVQPVQQINQDLIPTVISQGPSPIETQMVWEEDSENLIWVVWLMFKISIAGLRAKTRWRVSSRCPVNFGPKWSSPFGGSGTQTSKNGK